MHRNNIGECIKKTNKINCNKCKNKQQLHTYVRTISTKQQQRRELKTDIRQWQRIRKKEKNNRKIQANNTLLVNANCAMPLWNWAQQQHYKKKKRIPFMEPKREPNHQRITRVRGGRAPSERHCHFCHDGDGNRAPKCKRICTKVCARMCMCAWVRYAMQCSEACAVSGVYSYY